MMINTNIYQLCWMILICHQIKISQKQINHLKINKIQLKYLTYLIMYLTYLNQINKNKH